MAGAKIDPAASWLRYDVEVNYIEDNQIVRHKPLAGVVNVAKSRLNFTGDVVPVLTNNNVTSTLVTVNNDAADRVQRMGAPSCTLILSGSAARFGYRINPPRIEGPGIVQMRQDIREKHIGMFEGVPVWALVWQIVYLMTKPIAAVPVVANPGLLTDGAISADNGEDSYSAPIRSSPVGNSDPFVNVPLRG